MSSPLEKKAPPIKFLLTCSDNQVGNFELAKLSEVANLRREMIELFDKLVDTSAQAVLAAWLRTIDREDLKRQLLESSTVTIEGIMAEAKAQIRNQGRSEEEIEDYGKMPSPWAVRPHMAPEEAKQARKDSIRNYRERKMAAGKCEKCSKPLDLNSVRECTKCLAKHRERDRKDREKKGAQIGMHGRHPNTLAALKEATEKRKKT